MDLQTFASDPTSAALADRAARALLATRSLDHARAATTVSIMAAEAALDAPMEPAVVPRAGRLILGVGLAYDLDGDGKEHPTLLVDRSLLDDEDVSEGNFIPVREHSVVQEALARLGVPGASYRYLLVDPPLPHFHPSQTCTCLGLTGTLGACATAASGQPAILTAGHAVALNAIAHDAAASPGWVSFASDPASTPGVTPAADVAVVEPQSAALGSGGPPISRAAAGGPADVIDFYGQTSGQVSSQIMGFSPFLYTPKMAGMWGQVYFTTAGVTQAGDSGAPVLRNGTDELIGHLVGASGTAMSYVQAVEFQLQASGATLRTC